MPNTEPYLLSVVTPFHNVDMKLFEKCCQSLRDQTFGFENIEWVIVVHNSEGSYLKAVQELVGDFPNVKVYELHNTEYTPSSPRNYALERMTGAYVGFLDGDDRYTTDVCEKAMKHLVETDADLAVFRFETESDDPERMVIRPYVLVDQTQEVILVEHDTWDSRTFIYGAGLNVTAKIYRKRFLDDIGVRFDVEVPFAEDNLFNMSCFGKAKKICFLPQLIGYIYFLNDGSMVQSFNKSTDEVLRYARGITKIFDHSLANGLYMNNVMWDLLGYQSAIMLASQDLDYATRKEIKGMLEQYLQMLEPIDVSKLYSKQMIKLIMSLPKLVLGHPRLMQGFAKVTKTLGIDLASKIKV
ncbi:MAG: glycosyltransferase [Coriobacteriales bacterium]|nr:glycosyltransferase [Coriobacteriales bacterium]